MMSNGKKMHSPPNQNSVPSLSQATQTGEKIVADLLLRVSVSDYSPSIPPYMEFTSIPQSNKFAYLWWRHKFFSFQIYC